VSRVENNIRADLLLIKVVGKKEEEEERDLPVEWVLKSRKLEFYQ
jgi:hypothetical protein